MSRVIPITGALAALLAAAPGALAQVTPSQDTARSPWPTATRLPSWGDTTSADSAAIRQALRGNSTEVALGRLAESRAEDSTVKGFAERMVSDHNSMNAQWAEVARNHEMKLGVDFGPAGQQAIARLEDLSGTAFDQAYMTEMIREHEQDLAGFQRMATSARSPEVRQLASSGTAIIRQHLSLAQQVGSRVGVSTTAGRVGGVTPAPTPAPAPAGNERENRNEGGTLRAEDRAFVQEVLQDHLMHIQLAQRAQREARSDETRRLAEQMEDEFEQWQKRWEDVAQRYDVKAPSHLGTLHGQKVEKLEQASNVDRTYTAIVAEHLESMVPYFEKEGQAVRAAPVRRLADEELPVIRQIVAGVRGLQGETKGRAEASDRQ
jgi:putative membrane protein